MKVLMVVTHLDVGGTETHVLSLARSLKRMGHIVGIASKGGPFVNKFRASKIPVHDIPINADTKQMAHTIRDVVRVEGYQVLHAHDEESFSMIGLGQSLIGIPSVITVHGSYHPIPSVKQASCTTKYIIVVSSGVYRWVRRIGIRKKHLALIPNGIETSMFAPAKNTQGCMRPVVSNSFVVAYVGRFEGKKTNVARNVMLASCLIANNYPRFRVVLQGVGPTRAQLIRQANRLNQRFGRKVIYFAPTGQSVQATYYAADVVIGSGRVAMEAMASGKPVIGLGTAGYEGIITPNTIQRAMDGNFGDHLAICPTKPDKLARDIRHLMSRPQYIRKLSTFNRTSIIAHFSARKVGRRIEKIYSEVLELSK